MCFTVERGRNPLLFLFLAVDKNERLGLYATYGTGREPHIEDAKTFKVTAQSKTGMCVIKLTNKVE